MRHLVVIAALGLPLIVVGPEGVSTSADACGLKVSIKGAKIAKMRKPSGSSDRTVIAAGPQDASARGKVRAGGDASGRGGGVQASGGGETMLARKASAPKRKRSEPMARQEEPAPAPEPADVGRKEEPAPKRKAEPKEEPTPKEEPAPKVEEPTPAPRAGGKFASHYYFGNASANLTAASEKKLEQTARWLKNHPDKSIVIEGHASTNGNPDANKRLSEERANAVKEQLVSLGADESRISVEAFGSDRPEFQPGSSAKNRRVVIVAK